MEIQPDDTAALKLILGEVARVTSRRGTVTAKTVVAEGSRPGTVFMTFQYLEAAANILTNDAFDLLDVPELKFLQTYAQPVGLPLSSQRADVVGVPASQIVRLDRPDAY